MKKKKSFLHDLSITVGAPNFARQRSRSRSNPCSTAFFLLLLFEGDVFPPERFIRRMSIRQNLRGDPSKITRFPYTM